LQLWDALTTNPVRVLNLAGRSDLAGLFVFPYSLRHGRWLCWLGANTSIAVMDLEAPATVRRVELPGPAGSYWTVSPDGRLLAGSFTTASNTVQSALWHLDTGAMDSLPRNFAPDSGGSVPPYGATFSPDGRRLGLMSRRPGDFTGMVWNVDRRKPQAILAGFERALSTMAFSADSRTVATATWNGEVQLWDADTGQPELPPLRGSHTGIYFLQFAHDGRSLMAAADDWTLFVWQLASHRLMLTLPQVLVPSQTTVLAGNDDHFGGSTCRPRGDS
jgi:WD40 repeat protein